MILLFASLIIVAIYSTKVSSRFGVPVLIAFIGIGLVVGSDALDFFHFDDATLTKRIADVLLIFILFVGGFQTRRVSLRQVAGPAISLATFGVAVTAGLLGFLIHFAAGLALANSFMLASIISSTDAAAVLLITKANPIGDRVATTLEVESAANDPVAILLTIALVESVAGKTGNAPMIVLGILWQLGGGVLVGFALGKLSRFLFDALESENRGYYQVLVIGVILLTYGVAELVKANGIIAVFLMGYLLGNEEFAGKRGVSNFLEGIAAFANVALFLMLGLLAFPRGLALVWKEGLVIAALMIFVVRPLAVLACTLPFRFTMRERSLVAWGGIKGAVPIVLATYPAAYGLDPAGTVFNIIFFAVLLSCLVQGTTMGPLARFLGLTVPSKPRSPYSVELHGMRKSDLDMFEIHVEADSRTAGRRILDLGLPKDVIISSIVRKERIVPPKGSTILEADDLLFVLCPSTAIDALSAELNARGEELDPVERREREIEERR